MESEPDHGGAMASGDGTEIGGIEPARWSGGRARIAALGLVILGSIALVASRPPIAQDPAYHAFADQRSLIGIPNFWNVASNLPFLLVGALGLRRAARLRSGPRASWLTLFAGIALVAAGSAYYHWNPGDATLVWDRLPMTIGFMGLFAALVSESVAPRLERALLPGMLAIGVASVGVWVATGDLRFYAWVQLLPLVTIPLLVALFARARASAGPLLVALAAYVIAKLAELYDRGIFAGSGELVGGHALKHLLAAGACWALAGIVAEE